MTRPAGSALLAAVTLLGACGAAHPVPALPLVRTASPAVGDVIAVAEQADALYLFARDRLTIERGGAAAAQVEPPEGAWAAAATIPALDGEGRWVVARTTTGGLWRITANGDLEPIRDRLGVTGAVEAIAASGSTVAIALPDEVAVLSDTRHIATFSDHVPGPTTAHTAARVAAPVVEIAAARARIALRRRDGAIELWDLAHGTRSRYATPGAIAAGFVDPAHAARLAVATPSALFVEERDGLHRMAPPGEIRAMAIAGVRIWLATARGLFVVERGGFRATAPDARPQAHADKVDRLFGLTGGDVLVPAAQGALTRLSLDTAPDPAWRAAVQPVFQRVCARCHLPGGSADLDLSSPAAWRAERGELVHRVIETRTMPPAGTELSDADRQALAGYLARP